MIETVWLMRSHSGRWQVAESHAEALDAEAAGWEIAQATIGVTDVLERLSKLLAAKSGMAVCWDEPPSESCPQCVVDTALAEATR